MMDKVQQKIVNAYKRESKGKPQIPEAGGIEDQSGGLGLRAVS